MMWISSEAVAGFRRAASMPEVDTLKETRDQLSREVRNESGTIKKGQALDTKLYQLHKDANDRLNCEKQKLTKSIDESIRQQYFDTISTKEINKQLKPSFLDLVYLRSHDS